MNKPHRITFTGLDEYLTVKDLVEIKRFSEYADDNDIQVEFGVLISEKPKSNRYPSMAGIETIINGLNPFFKYDDYRDDIVNLSFHFCGSIARQINNGILLAEDFLYQASRVQVNLCGELNLNNIVNQFNYSIVQCRGEFPTESGRAQWLYDISGGRGIEPESYPKAPSYYCGYAGGISESNVLEVIRKINNPGDYWIDMESNIRVNDKFDLDTCKRIYDKVLNA